jgi:hypothetical protein
VATLITIIAQNSQRAPQDDGIGIGLILVGVLIAAAVATTIFLVFTRLSRRESAEAPGYTPHEPGHVGTADPPDARTGARIDPSRRGVEQSGSSSGS